MDKQSNTLDDLIHKASQEAQEDQARLDLRRHSSRAPGGLLKLITWAAICVIASGWAILQLLSLLLPASQGQIRSDLALAAQQARQEIEAARKRDGVLPPSIPNAALAGLVSYEMKGTGYQLVVLTVKDRLAVDETGAQVVSERKSAP